MIRVPLRTGRVLDVLELHIDQAICIAFITRRSACELDLSAGRRD